MDTLNEDRIILLSRQWGKSRCNLFFTAASALGLRRWMLAPAGMGAMVLVVVVVVRRLVGDVVHHRR